MHPEGVFLKKEEGLAHQLRWRFTPEHQWERTKPYGTAKNEANSPDVS